MGDQSGGRKLNNPGEADKENLMVEGGPANFSIFKLCGLIFSNIFVLQYV